MTGPSLVDAFRHAAGSGRAVVAARAYQVDCDTPLAVFARLQDLGQPAFLLESAEGGETWGRYSFIGLGTVMTADGYADRVELRGPDGEVRQLPPGLQRLRELLDAARPDGVSLPERFAGGWVGYIAYDAVRELERIPDRHAAPQARLFRFVMPSVLCVFDGFRHDLRLFGLGMAPASADLAEPAARAVEAALDRVEARLLRDTLGDGLERVVRVGAEPPVAPISVASNLTRQAYMEGVTRAQEYILAGDIFQVVLSQRLEAHGVTLGPLAIYRRLRRQNPSPYLFYLSFADETLIGASPEVMVRLTGRKAELRPIAGTRRRGASPEEDAQLEADLLADPKERAEHVMLLDLGRNDLGRVCRIGSIAIPEQMVVERYSRVMHLVSHVQGELRPELDWLDLLGATFPAGTLTGAPKIRAMQIIDELEPSRREVYGGAIGYIGFDGNMDLCIAIRTIHVRGERHVVQAGAGIVADSVPEREYEETLSKAGALLGALGQR